MSHPSAPNTSAETDPGSPRPFSLPRYAAAWAVHAYTASGVVLGFLALQATLASRVREAFLWMFVAVLVDATDGTFARLVDIKRVLPWFDGARLDDIIDYFTFVIVPIALLYHLQMLPAAGTLLFVALPLLASAYGFCQAAAKTPDFYFTGFPSYWNIVAFYLCVGQTPQWFNGVLIVTLSVMVFVPVRYVYPTRTVRFRALTNVLGGLWGGSLLLLLALFSAPPTWLLLLSLFYPVYYTALSFYLHLTEEKLPANS